MISDSRQWSRGGYCSAVVKLEYEIAVDEEIVIVDSIHDQIHTSVTNPVESVSVFAQK